MRRLLNWLSRKRYPYEPLIQVTISRGRLLHNLEEYRKLAPGGLIAPVLKSNAYGHGLIEVAKILKKRPGIPFFVVDSYFEAVALRAKGIKKPLLIIGYNRPRTMLESSLKDVSFAVTSMDTLREIKDTKNPSRIQLKIDTGMHRQGIAPEEIDEALAAIASNPNLFLEGICTHLCDADSEDETYTEAQLTAWNRIVAQVKAFHPNIKYIHSCNSAGSRFSKESPDNLIRLGIGLYGLDEAPSMLRQLNLQPVLQMETILSGLRSIKKGQSVGYSRTFVAPKDMTIATVPVGYYEGISRSLSNAGAMLVGLDRVPCHIIGRVSMNICTIDVSPVKYPTIGMEVIAISRERSDPNSISNMSHKEATIPYEAVVRIPAHLKREVID